MSSCDVFLSYSQSADPQPFAPGGASWAVRFQERLAEDLSHRLQRPVTVFLDQRAMPNGTIANSLRKCLEGASAFVAIVSERWANNESWCPWELAHFRNCAPLHTELPDARISKILLRPSLNGSSLPRILDEMPAYHFYGKIGVNGSSETYPISVPDLPGHPEHTRLIENLVRVLGADSQLVSDTAQGIVFVGAVPPELEARRERLCTELRKRNLRPVCDAPWPEVQPSQFREEIGRRLSQCDATVHLIGPLNRREHWQASVPEMELETALSVADIPERHGFAVLVWPSSDNTAPVATEWEPLLQRAKNISRASVLESKTWEYALSNIHDTLRRRTIFKEPEQSLAPDSGKEVFIQCLEDDRACAQIIRAALESKGHRVRYLPQLRGWAFKKKRKPEDLQRHDRYMRFYRESHGLLVLYGKSEEFWVSAVCDEIRDHLAENGLKRRAPGVYLAPPESEKDFRDYDFPNYQLATIAAYEAQLAQAAVEAQ